MIINKKILLPLALCFFLAACESSRKIYHPPALGAEYQFDRGMPAAKHPSQVFDEQTEKYMQEQGMPVPSGGKGGAPSNPVSKAGPGSSGSSGAVQHGIEPTSPVVPKGNPVSPDSSHTVQH